MRRRRTRRRRRRWENSVVTLLSLREEIREKTKNMRAVLKHNVYWVDVCFQYRQKNIIFTHVRRGASF